MMGDNWINYYAQQQAVQQHATLSSGSIGQAWSGGVAPQCSAPPPEPEPNKLLLLEEEL